TAFDRLYEQRYAHHSPEEQVEMVNIRLAVIGKRPRPAFPAVTGGATAQPARTRQVYASKSEESVAWPVYLRESFGARARVRGPALIQEHGTTTVLLEEDACRVAPSGELIITLGASR